MAFEREQSLILQKRLKEPRRFIQSLLGPRQVGKTTLVKKVCENLKLKHFLFISADEPYLHQFQNLNEIWQNFSTKISQEGGEGLLVIDEIHKYPDWNEVVKARWDADTRKEINLKIVILGSAPLLIQNGLSDSLAGRFEVIDVPHWNYIEVHAAFQKNLDQFIYFGGYPGPYHLIDDEERWRSYIKNSLIETTIARDIMLLTRIEKPALLRQLFYLACQYSGQVLSYQKMLGQLQDAGNTTTLAHYLELLSAVGFVKGLQKFTGSKVVSRSSSPKLQVYNTGLLSALSEFDFKTAYASPEKWGRWVESAVGAHLLNKAIGSSYKIEYWKEGNYEVDFVISHGKSVVGIEVKSGRKREIVSGLNEFKKKFKPQRCHVIGLDGIEFNEFFKMNIQDLFNATSGSKFYF